MYTILQYYDKLTDENAISYTSFTTLIVQQKVEY